MYIMGMENTKALLEAFDKVLGKIMEHGIDIVHGYIIFICIGMLAWFFGCIIVGAIGKIIETVKNHKHAS